MIITEKNLELYAAKYYRNINCISKEEFIEDFNRFKYIKRLMKRYKETGDLKERLILNHIVILYNTFDPKACTRMLFFKLKEFNEILKPFLLFLNRLPPHFYDENRIIFYTSQIGMDLNVIKALRNIK
jgi:hypothetical protein